MWTPEDLNLHDLEDQNKEREEEIDLGDEEEQEEIETSSAARASEEKRRTRQESDSQRRQVLVNNSVIFYFILWPGINTLTLLNKVGANGIKFQPAFCH